MTDKELLDELYSKGYLSILDDSSLHSRVQMPKLKERLEKINIYGDLEISSTAVYHETGLVDIYFIYNSNQSNEDLALLREKFEEIYWQEEPNYQV